MLAAILQEVIPVAPVVTLPAVLGTGGIIAALSVVAGAIFRLAKVLAPAATKVVALFAKMERDSECTARALEDTAEALREIRTDMRNLQTLIAKRATDGGLFYTKPDSQP